MKSIFQTSLVTSVKEGSDKVYILHDSLIYWSETIGLVELPVGFETDFSSVPRLPIIFSLWGDRNHREGALHDYLDRKDAKPELPCMVVNGVFLEAMKSRGVAWYIRWPMYLGVVAGNWAFYHQKFVRAKL